MTFLPFVLMMGALHAGLVVLAAWTFRASAAPLALKIVLPTCLLAFALVAPWLFAAMLGRPVPTSADHLPDGARLIAVQMFDGDARAQIWLNEGESTRLYEINVDAGARQELRKARQGVTRGDQVTVHTGARTQNGGLSKQGSEGFEADIRSRLPEKSGEQE